MVTKWIHATGLRSSASHAASLGSVLLCLALWMRAKTVDQSARGNAERRAIFVGLWPPMFWLIGDALERLERPAHRRRGALRAGMRLARRRS